jgi:DNA-binding HxlR family transcriptional regulator
MGTGDGDVRRSTCETDHPGPRPAPLAGRGALRWAFGFLGKRWNGMLLFALMAGPLGFADLRRTIGGISDSMLSERLAELTAAGLVARHVHHSVPPTVEYQLTATGQELLPVLEELATWATKAMQTCAPSAAPTPLPDDAPR